MIVLSTVNDALELVTSSTANIDYYISFAQITSSSITIDSTQGTIASATTTTILSSPSGGEQYQVKLITITNRHATSSCNVTIQKDVSGTNYIIGGTYTLARGEESLNRCDGIYRYSV
jgi:hypothetical protein